MSSDRRTPNNRWRVIEMRFVILHIIIALIISVSFPLLVDIVLNYNFTNASDITYLKNEQSILIQNDSRQTINLYWSTVESDIFMGFIVFVLYMLVVNISKKIYDRVERKRRTRQRR